MKIRVGEAKALQYMQRFPLEFVRSKLYFVLSKNKSKPIANLEAYISAIFEKANDFEVQQELANPSMTAEQRREAFDRQKEIDDVKRHEAAIEETRQFLEQIEKVEELMMELDHFVIKQFEKEMVEPTTILANIYKASGFESLIVLAHMLVFLERNNMWEYET